MTKEIEATIAALNRTLGSFCEQLQSSVDALRQSVNRHPILLDSASLSFVQRLNHRLLSADGDLELLESMSFGTVSFEELLGHCNEVLKKIDVDVAEVLESLRSFGYLPSEVDFDGECALDCEPPSSELDLFIPDKEDSLQEVSPFSAFKSFEEDPLLDDSMSLKKIGISEASLASIASTGTPFAANGKIVELELSLNTTSRRYTKQRVSDVQGQSQYTTAISAINEVVEDDLKSMTNAKSVQISVDDFECLPSYMKSLASWEVKNNCSVADHFPYFFVTRSSLYALLDYEDLHAAVEKINSSLDQKEDNYFLPDEISSLNLGPKKRSYLLLLVRMNKLVVETINGMVAYRAL